MEKYITGEDLAEFSGDFKQDRANLIAMNTVTANGLQNSARQYTTVRADQHQYALKIDQHGITAQKKSGRCWMFGGFNFLRTKLIQDLNLEDFTFSGNYLMFYDKLEKANCFLEGILNNLDQPVNSRMIAYLLRVVTADGGEWDMFVNLVKKYGVVPAEAQPECISSENSVTMAPVLKAKLREFARDLRRAYREGHSMEELRAMKEKMLNTVYRMNCICYGEPVKRFDFEVRNKNNKFISSLGITPLEFYHKYIGVRLEDYISLFSGATEGRELKKYEVPYGDVVGGRPTAYVSVPVETLKKMAITQMKAGEPVWFSCDVGERSWRKGGILDDHIFDYEKLFNTEFRMTKPERFEYRQAYPSHAMLFKGVDFGADGKPVRWCVENSWGKENGKKGMFVMSDSWFDKYTYEVVINKKYLPTEIINTYENTEAIKLAPWTPQA